MLTVNYGQDIVKVTYDALVASNISEFLRSDFHVAIKPNLVLARPASEGATTHPGVVEGILLYLKEYGVSRIKIMESSQIGDDTDRAFDICNYRALGKKYSVLLADLKKGTTSLHRYGEYEIEICNHAMETDFLINVPVLKAHCQTKLTCAMKNLKGCIPEREMKRFHTLGLHEPIATLNAILKTGYCVVDGICGDLDFEEGGNPTYANRIIAGQDPVLVDSYCAQLIGYTPEEIGYLSLAKKWGIGTFFSPDTPINELNEQNKPRQGIISSRLAARYKPLIREDSACSACYAALVHALHRTKASPREPIGIGQGFIGMQHPGLGVGNCTRGFTRNVTGCPPKATDIIKALH